MLRKTTVTVPHDLLVAVDRMASAKRESRSRFVTDLLREAVRAHGDAEIAERLNELFAAPEVAEQQSRDALELDRVGSAWADERW